MVLIPLIFSQSARGKECVCELQNSDPAFPENKLDDVEFTATQCTENITSEKMTEIDRLVLGLQHRIRQLLDNVSMLEKEDNRNLYAAVSLRIIELELAEIQDLLDKLNKTTNNYQQLSVQAAEELEDMEETMTELEKFDHVQVMVKQRENQRIKRDLEHCKAELNSTSPAPTLSPGYCGLGRMVNVSGPITYSLTVYGTSYSFGAWGRDASPAPGDENNFSESAATGKECVCDLKNVDPPFPKDEITKVETTVLKCIESITSEKMTDLDRLALGLQQRVKQLEENVVKLEKEEKSSLYGALSLRIIESEFAEIQDLLNKLNRTTSDYQHLSVQAAAQLENMKDTMVELEKFDKMQVMKRYRENLIKETLEKCKEELEASSPPPTVPPARCGRGQLVNVAGPRTYSITPYGTSYPYGAWGRDVKPSPGDENKYWLVVLTSSNVYGYYVRQYGTLSTLLLVQHGDSYCQYCGFT
ncbi:hypothetical protein Q8A67_025187 [Cirrhinus molitorella]|uniref:Uncharacterized protein n=1 Tax=Cirrhinus molitorella TaxID=172907 RepID=A0AA88NX88_9TELE|nr:hypothetical protein Q8A67_025187 [Cirrhinus molitorella]